MSTMVGYAISEFAAGSSAAGLTSGIFIFGGCFGRIIAGRALERYGERGPAAIFFALFVCSAGAYFLASSLTVLLVIRLFHGLCFGVTATILAGAAMRTVPPARRGEGSGWFSTGTSMATGIAPFVGMWLASLPHGYAIQFGVSTGIAGASTVLALACWKQLSVAEPGQEKEPEHGINKWLAPKALPIALVVSCCSAAYGFLLSFLQPFAAHRSLEGPARWYFVVYAAVILLSRPIGGVVQDRRGDDVVVIPTLLCFTCGYLLTANAHGSITLLAGAALLGLGYGTGISAGQASAVAKAGQRRAGMAVSSYYLLIDLATGVGPFVIGAVLPLLGYQLTFSLAGCLALIGLALYLTWARKIPDAKILL
ncbi:hypothetical protein HMPREF3152_10285 [Actinomyces sp. HMSC06A08]|nr:hypothetical protein HMPREF3152_10285 [Actinomyces sp. HMSC06A08]